MPSNYDALFVKPKGVYALSHSVGPLSKAADKALQSGFLAPWKELGGDAWPSWLNSINIFCQQIGLVINANEKDICPQVNLASGFSAFLTAIAKLPAHKHQNTILMHREAFASMGFVVTALTQTYGLRLVLIEGDPNNTDAWLDAFEQHSVLACLVTHVHSNTSIKSDVEAICRLAKQFEAFALVDVAQSIGVVPINVQAWHADAVFGSCVKWLCGGPGAGFMYVNPNLTNKLKPDPVGWFSHENPFEFDIENFEFESTAKRFWGGTPSVAPYVMAAASIQTMLGIGLEEVVMRNLSLKRHLLKALQNDHPSKILLDSLDKQGGSLCLQAIDHAKTLILLQEHDVKFDQRGKLFRISLHVMNSESDIEIITACFK